MRLIASCQNQNPNPKNWKPKPKPRLFWVDMSGMTIYCFETIQIFLLLEICQFEEKLKILSPCFNESLNNQNYAYIRQDLSCNNSLTKLINTTNETYDSKLGLFLKSLNKSVLNKYANKDILTSWGKLFSRILHPS